MRGPRAEPSAAAATGVMAFHRCRAAAALGALWSVAVCACAPRVESPPPAPERSAADAEAARAADSLLAAARAAFATGAYAQADALAGELLDRYPETPAATDALWLGAQAAYRSGAYDRAAERAARYARAFPPAHPAHLDGTLLLARVRLGAAEPADAAEALLALEPYLDPARRDTAAHLLRAALALAQRGELDALARRAAGPSPFAAAVHAERALRLAAAGAAQAAEAAAHEALRANPLPEDQARAREIVEARPARRAAIAAILPLRGPLAVYGEHLSQGIRLALDEYARTTGDTVELVLLDETDPDALTPQRLGALARDGVLGVVGPVTPDALRQAAGARGLSDLVLVSPTVPDADTLGRHVYSLQLAGDDLDALARALARFGVAEMGARRIAIVFPADSLGYRQALAFADEARRHGADVIATEAYPRDATTYQHPLAHVDSLDPEALYAVAPDPRTVLQLAPQIAYYGLRGIQIFGDPNWADPETIRRLEPRFTNGAVAATYLGPWQGEPAHERFQDLYEATYRKALGGNPLPGLAYDAASLILRAMPPREYRHPAVLSRALSELPPFEGATGVLEVEGDRVRRRPFLVEIWNRRIVPAVPRPILRPATTEGPTRPGGGRP